MLDEDTFLAIYPALRSAIVEIYRDLLLKKEEEVQRKESKKALQYLNAKFK